MRISSINSTNYNKPQNTSVSMKGLDPTTLIIYKIIKMGADGARDIQRSSKKASLLRRLIDDTCTGNIDNTVRSIQAIAKLPDSFYAQQGSFDTCVPILSHLRQNLLDCVAEIPDSNATYIHTKKDYINSLFNNGHEITKKFRDFFGELDDGYYRLFKQEILDKCFFSPQFNSMRKSCASMDFEEFYNHHRFGGCFRDQCGHQISHIAPTEQIAKATGRAYCNLKLLETLDRDIYKSYFNARASIINKNKDYLKNKDDFSTFSPYDEVIGPLLDL